MTFHCTCGPAIKRFLVGANAGCKDRFSNEQCRSAATFHPMAKASISSLCDLKNAKSITVRLQLGAAASPTPHYFNKAN